MSLDEYRRKRDFRTTPEPDGARAAGARAAGPRSGGRRFVVQRHRASRLHYDVRLELGGVLVSWAVPRGPSMRALTRRHAARTEDHPLEYADFEGSIPAGAYGAGDVIVWDQGTWEPEGLDDPVAALEAGELKFVLRGERLRGRFVLVRTRRLHHASEDWLLIKKQDDACDPFWDIRDHATSVLSGLTNEEIAARRAPPDERPAAASRSDVDLSAARQTRLPSFVPFMTATAVDGAFDDDDWFFELKLDGYRLQAIVHGHAVSLRTRSGQDAARIFPAFAATSATSWLGAYDAIVDGEMVALDEEGRPSFGLLQDLAGMRGLGHGHVDRSTGQKIVDGEPPRGTLVYHAFDLLYLDSWDLLEVPLEERKRTLQLVLRDHPSVRYVRHVVGRGEAFHKAVVEQGLEGSVAKLRGSRYEPGTRSRAWLKIKARREQEFVVVGYEPGSGSHRDLGSLLLATWEAGSWRYAGKVGSGLDGRTRTTLRRILDEHALSIPPVNGAPALSAVRWSEPLQVIRVEFTEWTREGLLRQAVYKGRETDRDPRSVSRESVEHAAQVRQEVIEEAGRTEEPVGAPDKAHGGAAPPSAERPPPSAERPPPSAELARAPGPAAVLELVHRSGTRRSPAEAVTQPELDALLGLGQGGTWEVGGHAVELTNLDKVLFPVARVTKRDLIRYYTTIAPLLLPYLRDRPLNVHRWPDGVSGRTHFWQKQIPSHAPDWINRWDYPEAGHDQSHTYLVADQVATLAWLANQAVIDLHPWTSRLPEYWRPTYVYLDIDPGERTTWPQVLTLARLYRTALQHLGVRGHPKVTGKRGIQVWIHVEPRYTFDETRAWAGQLSQGVGEVVPDLISWEWGRADRGGRARLDYTQNSPIKTLVAPYAVRPVPSAAVSAPITWEELDDPTLRPDGWDVRTIIQRVTERGDLFRGVLGEPQELPKLG